MSDESLFGDLPQSEPRRAPAAGAARLREPVRDQIELRPVDLDALIAIDATGSDRGLLHPMLAAIQRRLSQLPKRYAADAGYTKNIDIEWAAQQGVDVYCPPINAKQGTDPFALKPDDGPGVAAWRARMASDAGKAHYKRRAIAECVNARARSAGLGLSAGVFARMAQTTHQALREAAERRPR
jgi:hypothetical protein